MATHRQKIINRLQSLNWIDGVTVKPTKGEKGVTVTCKREKALNFKFRWANDHFMGYFVDSNRSKSQAVLSLWTPMDAIHFATAYSLLVQLRAMRPAPSDVK